jgi:putative membrane protein
MNKLIYPIAAAAFVSSASLAFAADNASQNFIKDAIQGNLAEVAVGKLAQQKGNSDAVRSFGQMLATEHARRRAAHRAGQEAAGGLRQARQIVRGGV